MWYMIYYTQNKGTAQRSNYPKSCTGVHSILKAVSLKCKKDSPCDVRISVKAMAMLRQSYKGGFGVLG